jgi:S1-C subfamily serine protease
MPIIAMVLLVLLGPVAGTAESLGDGVVKVMVDRRSADYEQPWQTLQQEEISGSGFVIDGQRILTNAHMVADDINIEVQKPGDSTNFEAELEYIAKDCDLAILTVKDPSFFAGMTPVQWGGLPEQDDKISVYGYPQGGTELAVTEGFVSRIEEQYYPLSRRYLLTMQVDASINPGNSGGPAFSGGKAVGVAFMYSKDTKNVDSKNIGYVIPAPVVQRFLADIAKGSYTGVPSLGADYTTLTNPDFRAWCAIPPDQEGVHIDFVEADSSALGVLQAGDVLLELDGQKVGNDGMIRLRDRERVPLDYAVQVHQAGDPVSVQVWRDKSVQKLSMTLKTGNPLVDLKVVRKPTYLIYGGMVFQPLTINYLTEKRSRTLDSAIRLSALLVEGRRTHPRQQVVILNQVLPDDGNRGYQHLADRVVERVNGKSIYNMVDLIMALEHTKAGYEVIELDDIYGTKNSPSFTVVMRTDSAQNSTRGVLSRFEIPDYCSKDLKQLMEKLNITDLGG